MGERDAPGPDSTQRNALVSAATGFAATAVLLVGLTSLVSPAVSARDVLAMVATVSFMLSMLHASLSFGQGIKSPAVARYGWLALVAFIAYAAVGWSGWYG
jgi:hypothetical protein